MQNISEKVADSIRRNAKPNANPANKVTASRRKLFQNIKERTGGNVKAEMDFAISILERERPKIEKYVLSMNEVPMDNIGELATQAYNLRCREIDTVMKTINVSEPEALIFIENDESETENSFNDETNDFIGHLFAPVGIVAKNMHNENDNFIDPSIIGGIVNTVGGKLGAAQLKRAAENKNSGIVGFLTGGKNEYEIIRKYLQDPANVAEKNAVLAGTIKDVSQLKGFAQLAPSINQGLGVNVAGSDVVSEIARIKRRETFNKYLPFVIIGLIVLIFATIYITKHASKNK